MLYTDGDFMWRTYMVGLRALRADLAPLEIRGRLFGLYRSFFDAGDIIGPMMVTYLCDVNHVESGVSRFSDTVFHST